MTKERAIKQLQEIMWFLNDRWELNNDNSDAISLAIIALQKESEKETCDKPLKPCPFCGSMPQAGVEFYESGREVKLSAVVECSGCGIRKRKIFKATDNISLVPFNEYENSFKEVINAWNERAEVE